MQCLNQLELFAELKWASSQIVLNLGLGMGMRMRIHAVHADDADMRIAISGETLCRDNCQLIGIPFFHTRSAGKNNRN